MEIETQGYEGAEEQVVAEPVANEAEPTVSEGAEEQVVAEPANQKTEADAAFAEMRRQNEELQRQLIEQQRRAEAQENALGLYFQGDNKVAQALAYHQNRPVEEVQAELAAQAELESLRAENERMRREQITSQAQLQMSEDLQALQRLDSNIKSIDELGQTFLDLRLKGGLSVEDAYFALQAKKEATSRKAANPPGQVNTVKAQKDFLTVDEVRAHENDKAWIDKNFELIQKSMRKW